MIGDPLGRLQRDLDAAARDLDDLDLTAANERLASVVAAEAPVVTGYLAGSVYADSEGVGVGAIYAGVVHDSNPYAERALGIYDPADAVAEAVDDVFGANLQTIYT